LQKAKRKEKKIEERQTKTRPKSRHLSALHSPGDAHIETQALHVPLQFQGIEVRHKYEKEK
jgi:hypothetical protein